MMKHYKTLLFAAIIGLTACSSDDAVDNSPSDAIELRGIQVAIDGSETFGLTRAAATPAPLKEALGRTTFAKNDELTFTTIKRTDKPLVAFTYSDISYQYDGTNWERTSTVPEKLYWTDGNHDHTFIGYCLPSKDYPWEASKNATGSDTYAGELGQDKEAVIFKSNADVMDEDLLVLYSDTTKADNGGLSTKVYFNHALSGVRVVVNIKDFAASSSAEDTKVVVSDMVLKDQPTKFTWGADSRKLSVLNLNDATQLKKNLTLWCPAPDGEGTAQSKTFTFYGLTTPQDDVFHEIAGNQTPLAFSFQVTYPDPLKTGETLTKTYSGKFAGMVDFHSGKCTTLNISLNHKDEQMVTDVAYSDWNLVPTPDLGELRKKSTFMDINATVTIHTDEKATIDDATWLYNSGSKILDIYGHSGDSKADAYVIKSASQLLSLAKEVNSGVMTFAGKYIRLDADITMQSSTTSADVKWQGIGTEGKPFQGTFLGGDRFINRLSGSGLFGLLGENACVEQLQITTVGSIQGGALAVSNGGIIGGCRVVDDITTDDGALVGTNSGTIHACYCTGEITGGKGSLIGSDKGKAVGCYTASEIEAFDDATLNTKVTELNQALEELYKSFEHTQYQFKFVKADYPVVTIFHKLQ